MTCEFPTGELAVLGHLLYYPLFFDFLLTDDNGDKIPRTLVITTASVTKDFAVKTNLLL